MGEIRGTKFQFSLVSALLMFMALGVGIGLAVTYAAWRWEISSLTVVAVAFILIQSQPNPLVFYLRYVNPLLAVVVLVVCLFAGTTDGASGGVNYIGFFREPVQSYFIGKGIFCGLALFLLGKVAEVMLAIRDRVQRYDSQRAKYLTRLAGRPRKKHV
jgi:hypothetical protein